MKEGEFSFNMLRECTWRNDQFPTFEEALAAGIKMAKEEKWETLFIGQVVEVPVTYQIDADDIVERIAENIDENYGDDWEPGEEFLENLEKGDIEALQEELDGAISRWVEKRKIRTHCFTMENVGEVKLDNVEDAKHE